MSDKGQPPKKDIGRKFEFEEDDVDPTLSGFDFTEMQRRRHEKVKAQKIRDMRRRKNKQREAA